MKLYILPEALYGMDGIKEILYAKDNCIVHKKLNENIIDSEKLIVSHSIVYLVHGNIQINTFDGDEVSITNGEMLFMPRDSYLISDYVTKDNGLEAYLIFFNHNIVEKFLEGFFTTCINKSSICKLETNKNIESFFQNIMQMNYEETNNSVLLELKILEFLNLVVDTRFKETLFTSEMSKKRRTIESLMTEHYDKNLSISDYASLSGRSLSTFNREFKKKHTQTPKKWLIEKKMNQAHILLIEGINVTESAFEVGYKNVSHFIKAYKSVYNQTPKEMQKLIRTSK